MNLNDPNFFIPAAILVILGILGISIFLMRKGHKTMAAVSLVSAFIAVLATGIGLFVTVGIPEAAIH